METLTLTDKILKFIIADKNGYAHAKEELAAKLGTGYIITSSDIENLLQAQERVSVAHFMGQILDSIDPGEDTKKILRDQMVNTLMFTSVGGSTSAVSNEMSMEKVRAIQRAIDFLTWV